MNSGLNELINNRLCLVVGIVCCFLAEACKNTPSHSANNTKTDYQEETFSFAVDDGKQTLPGTLSIPNGFDSSGKAIILVAPPGAFSRNYIGLYSGLAKELSRNGIAVLRYDNRHVLDTTLLPQNFTMFDQAVDAENAYSALKKDSRFDNVPIGLLGHSEGGASVAIAASRNRNISFVILLSTAGISGAKLAYQQAINKLEKLLALTSLTQGREPDSLQKEVIYSRIKNINNIIAKHRDIDSIYTFLKKQNKHFYDEYHEKYPELFGTASIETHNKRDSLKLLTPHNITLIQFQPELYYPNIKCPSLAVFGKMDEKVFWQENLKGMEKLFKKGQKENYKTVVFDSLDHDYRKVEEHNNPSRLIPTGIIHEKKPTEQKEFYSPAFTLIAKWVNERI